MRLTITTMQHELQTGDTIKVTSGSPWMRIIKIERRASGTHYAKMEQVFGDNAGEESWVALRDPWTSYPTKPCARHIKTGWVIMINRKRVKVTDVCQTATGVVEVSGQIKEDRLHKVGTTLRLQPDTEVNLKELPR
jgi:hypothetical protein